MSSHLVDMSGQRFGRLFVAVRDTSRRNAYWFCDCDCGARVSVEGSSLRMGKTVSCGCKRRESPGRELVHGHARSKGRATSEYKSWRAMLARCENPKADGYERYGAAGVTVCDRWRDFALFLADMGDKPEPKRDFSIDRYPNNRGNYEPGNCRWATRSQQERNKPKYQKRLEGVSS